MKSPEQGIPRAKTIGTSRDLRVRAEALLTASDSEIDVIPAEEIKKLVHELRVHQSDLGIQNERLREIQWIRSSGGELRQRAEALLCLPDLEIASIPGGDVKALVHELQVHQMELEIQNEELREAQLELSEARDRYSDLYEFAPVGYLTLDSDGAILEANLTAATMLGVDRTELVGARLSDFVDRDNQDVLFLYRRRVFSTDTVQTCDLVMNRWDGTRRDIRLESIVFLDKATEKPSCRTALIDITGKKEAEEWKALANQVLQMVEHLPAGAVYVDHERLQMNRAAEEITGYTKEELQSLDQWFRALHGDRHEEIRKLYESRYATGLLDREMATIIRKDGEERCVEISGHRFDDHAVWILQDVTERENAQETLRKSEERIRSILNAAVDAIITIDRKGTIVASNPATGRIFGYSETELPGQNISMLMPSPDRELHDNYLSHDPGTGETCINGIGRDVTGRRKDGSTFPADFAVSDADHLGFFTGIIRDITQRKRAEEALKLEHEFSENLIETTRSIILVLDPDGRIIRFNSIFEHLFGRTLEETEGLDWFETFLHERDRKRIRSLFDQVIRGETTRGTVTPILTKDEEERNIEWYGVPLREPDGNLIGLICNGIDITERHCLEQEVYKAAEEEKIRIAGDLHDGLGSLLTGISYLATALSVKLHRGETVAPKEADAILKNIHDAIGQTRALSRGLHRVSDEPDALTIALKDLAGRTQSTSKMNCRFTGPDREVTIGDPIAANHLFRIAQEAVNNAVRHSGGTHLTVRLDEKETGELKLSIKDNGKGFDPAETRGNGLGLHTMEYRARAIGAEFALRPRKKTSGSAVTCVWQIGRDDENSTQEG